jgi:hypothetical protein
MAMRGNDLYDVRGRSPFDRNVQEKLPVSED